MTRYRSTIRGDGCEMRGYFTAPTAEALTYAANAAQPFGLLIASPVASDYNPFKEPTNEQIVAAAEVIAEEANEPMWSAMVIARAALRAALGS